MSMIPADFACQVTVIINSSLISGSGRCWPVDTYNPCPGVHENVPSRWHLLICLQWDVHSWRQLFNFVNTSVHLNRRREDFYKLEVYFLLSRWLYIFSNDYKGGFGTALMTKDLGLAQDAATRTQAATPLGSLAHQVEFCNIWKYGLLRNWGILKLLIFSFKLFRCTEWCAMLDMLRKTSVQLSSSSENSKIQSKSDLIMYLWLYLNSTSQ